MRHWIRLGASVRNVTGAYITLDYGGSNDPSEVLPSIGRFGTSYRIRTHQGWLHDSLASIGFIVHVEYDHVLNYDFRRGLHIGGELRFLDLLAVRVGWYSEKVEDYDLPEANKDEITDVTYGFGVNVPLGILISPKWPLTLGFDYTSLPQVPYTQGPPEFPGIAEGEWDNFTTYSFRLNWALGTMFKPKGGGAGRPVRP
jgi:hypothetical protein